MKDELIALIQAIKVASFPMSADGAADAVLAAGTAALAMRKGDSEGAQTLARPLARARRVRQALSEHGPEVGVEALSSLQIDSISVANHVIG